MARAPFSIEWLSQSSHSQARREQSVADTLGETLSVLSGCFSLQDTEALNHTNLQLVPETGDGTMISKENERIKMPESEYSLKVNLGLVSISSSGARPGCSNGVDSGYESETGRSECTSPGKELVEEEEEVPATVEESCRLRRRLRTAFSAQQLSTLEKTFCQQKYLRANERHRLADKLQLSEVQIKTWFQNRRMKMKRQMQDTHPYPFPQASFYNFIHCGQQNLPPFQYSHYYYYYY
ncbi:homeobox protein vent1-like [Rhinatrema bivittatum]|uniref:homeobox protein vent1-like n=1 Tax=Rhinatrema bivittatum TaxID=194408 RepID=UPI00112EB4E8|nr:homeobox protein vent1-like [Rhinatrema bivittatum]